ncbi:MAG TPA: alpha/beta hydrolase-fold protein [Vicinamibacterales bacterium]|nr:alpha/beta hydrolase-fold protein [Vicinamibacterales bacterium]
MTPVRSTRLAITALGVFVALAFAPGTLFSQAPAPPGGAAAQAAPAGPPVTLKGKLERVKVHGKSLEGNLLGESPAPEVSIYLPPSYATDRNRRYPVVYLLHGYTGTDLSYFNNNGGPRFLPAIAERDYASGAAREMILVMPNAMNAFGGSMYSNSITAGDWEGYVAEDLVSYMDKNYRTIPMREARGLAGHSMGGYGTMRIAMKRPDVFVAIYALSSCCLNEGSVRGGRGGQPSPAEAIKTLEEARGNRGAQNTLVRAAAWSPNPANPPLYLDLPTKNGEVVPAVAAKWAANSPLAMLDQYVPNLRKYKAIAMDVGLQDGLIGSNRLLDEALTRYRIAHTFETYEGDHGNRIPQRLEEKVLPYFSTHLSFEQPKR